MPAIRPFAPPTPARRHVAAALGATLPALLLLAPSSAGPAVAQPGAAPAPSQTTSTPVRLARGEETTISLEENVTTGYAWRFDPGRSKDPACVTVTDLGHERRTGESAIGAPGLHRWRLRGEAAGHAELHFVYQRPWEQQPVREHTVVIDVR